jgi:hypothetical protein
MKRTLVILALVAAAGTAGAQTMSTPATGTATGGAATMTTPNASGGATMNSGATMNGSAGTRGAQTGGGAQMNSNAQMNSQAPGGQMNGNAGISTGADAGPNANIANAPAQRLTGAAGTAQKRIEQDGYKNVSNLQKGSDGLWRGTAMRGNAQVQVTVDRAGRVAAQ